MFELIGVFTNLTQTNVSRSTKTLYDKATVTVNLWLSYKFMI